ncbi:hypothetical protein ACF1BQ_033255 [Bradyrhizobium sp. RDT10]
MKRGGIDMALCAGPSARMPDQAAVGTTMATSFSTKLRAGFSGAESIDGAQLFYGVSKRIVWNQCVIVAASTTKIAITKSCGRVLIGRPQML